MIKTARKPSTDPAQEKLRQDKALWNKDVSAFVNDLIHLKKMMNGWPSKFHMEKSRIVDPVPADPTTIIGSLASDFQDIAQRGNKIVQLQLDYSKTRKKRQPKQMNLPFPAQPATPAPATPAAPSSPDLSQQLSLPAVASERYALRADGSNVITRFFSRILNPAIGGSPAARIRKYRMSMLTSALSTYRDLGRLQASIVGSSPESIFTSSKLLSRIEDQWIFLSQGFETFVSTMPGEIADVGGEIAPPQSKTEAPANQPSATTSVVPEAENAVVDFRNNMTNFLDLNSKKLNSLVMQFSNAAADVKIQLAPELLNAYRSLLAEANSQYGTAGNSLKEIFDAKSKKATAQLEVVAQNALSKYFGKLKHQVSPFDKTSAFRLDIYKMATECRKDVDEVMNLLERGFDKAALMPLISKIGTKILAMKDLQRALDATTRGKGFDRPFMDMLDRKTILDHNPNLNEKQRAHLQKLIEQRNLRDLTNLYTRK